jgi:hypothetical protein
MLEVKGTKTMPSELKLPTVHLNGSSKDLLLEANQAARSAIGEAIRALSDAAPHGRDYYPQGDDAYYAARDEHVARLRKLADVNAELEQIARGIRRSGSVRYLKKVAIEEDEEEVAS